MANIDQPGAQYHYNAVGSNTPVQATGAPARLYHISVSHNGGSMGYLQIYAVGTASVTAGTGVSWVLTVPSGTSGAGTPAYRDVIYGPHGRELAGLSYLWSAGSTGTVAHGVNAVVDITYQGTR